MLIQIRGVEFTNKGAELMLRAIVGKIRQVLPEAKLSMVANTPNAPYVKRAELGLYQTMWLQRYRIKWSRLGILVPKGIRETYGLVLDTEADVVLDASGFSYSDQWGPEAAILAAKAIRRWKARGAKVFFMPQAFGPFTGTRIRDCFKTIVEDADLVFARDEVSFGHIVGLVGPRDNVRIAPDFTNLIDGEVPHEFDAEVNRFCIIPNYRMIDKTDEEKSRNYLRFLAICLKYLHEKGAKPYILIHEGEKDLWLGREILREVGKNTNIVREMNPLYIKGIIGTSDAVLSSRFHGLVSALSQGVPALGVGWSHKYEMLFQDYDYPEGILSVDANIEEIQGRIDAFISDIRSGALKSRLLKAASVQKKASHRMWDEVFALITRH
jgi:colanic acid/amylovoran biosynthesis protein